LNLFYGVSYNGAKERQAISWHWVYTKFLLSVVDSSPNQLVATYPVKPSGGNVVYVKRSAKESSFFLVSGSVTYNGVPKPYIFSPVTHLSLAKVYQKFIPEAREAYSHFVISKLS
jgi:hypothetical protein